LQHFFV
jgi:hypothetical protein